MTVIQNDTNSLMISTHPQGTSQRLEANYLPNIDIYWLKKYHYLDQDRKGGFEWNDSFRGTTELFILFSHVTDFHPHIYIAYKLKNGKDYVLRLTLSRTQCSYDGWRFWFLCPLSKGHGLCCGKRVGVLYKVGDVFGCRHCLELTYTCRKRNSRHTLYSWFHATALEHRYNKYVRETKRAKYKHKFTKKYQRLQKLLGKMEDFAQKISE